MYFFFKKNELMKCSKKDFIHMLSTTSSALSVSHRGEYADIDKHTNTHFCSFYAYNTINMS